MAPPRHSYFQRTTKPKPMSHKVRASQVANQPICEAETDSFLTISLKRDTNSEEIIFPNKKVAEMVTRDLLKDCHDGCLTEVKVLNHEQCWIKLNFNRISVSGLLSMILCIFLIVLSSVFIIQAAQKCEKSWLIRPLRRIKESL